MNITIKVREVYGQWRAYPVCEKAKALARLAGTKTLTEEAIKEAKLLGFSIQLQHEEFSF